jgi:hypothetical protein
MPRGACRLDLDPMDGNDNRLSDVTAEIALVPKPANQLRIGTPLHAVRNWVGQKGLTRRANHRHIFIIPEIDARAGKSVAGFFVRRPPHVTEPVDTQWRCTTQEDSASGRRGSVPAGTGLIAEKV